MIETAKKQAEVVKKMAKENPVQYRKHLIFGELLKMLINNIHIMNQRYKDLKNGNWKDKKEAEKCKDRMGWCLESLSMIDKKQFDIVITRLNLEDKKWAFEQKENLTFLDFLGHPRFEYLDK